MVLVNRKSTDHCFSKEYFKSFIFPRETFHAALKALMNFLLVTTYRCTVG